jgi:hypothetical protein
MMPTMTDGMSFHAGAPSVAFARDEGLPHELRRVARLTGALAARPDNLAALADAAHRALGYALRTGAHDTAGAMLRLLGRTAALRAARLLPGHGPASLALTPEAVITLPRVPADPAFNANAFIAGSHAALAGDDADALDVLCDLPAELLRAAAVRDAPFRLRQARALQGFRMAAGWCWDEVEAALREADPRELEPAFRDHALDIAVPELELMVASAGDASALPAVLAKALALHAAFWARIDPQAPEGLVALGPAAFAALLARRGGAVPGSPYLPPVAVA